MFLKRRFGADHYHFSRFSLGLGLALSRWRIQRLIRTFLQCRLEIWRNCSLVGLTAVDSMTMCNIQWNTTTKIGKVIRVGEVIENHIKVSKSFWLLNWLEKDRVYLIRTKPRMTRMKGTNSKGQIYWQEMTSKWRHQNGRSYLYNTWTNDERWTKDNDEQKMPTWYLLLLIYYLHHIHGWDSSCHHVEMALRLSVEIRIARSQDRIQERSMSFRAIK